MQGYQQHGSVGGLAGDGGGGYGDHGVAGVAVIINTAATQKSGHLLPCGEWRDLHQPIGCVYICFQTTRPILFDFLSLFLHYVHLHI